MVKKGLEKKISNKTPLSERAVFNQYMAYINGRIPDKLGENGPRIMSNAETIARVLGYSDVKSWLNSYTKPNIIYEGKNIPLEYLPSMKEAYKKIASLGRTQREINQAVGEIEYFDNKISGDNSGGKYLLLPYHKKCKLVSEFKKTYIKANKSN